MQKLALPDTNTKDLKKEILRLLNQEIRLLDKLRLKGGGIRTEVEQLKSDLRSMKTEAHQKEKDEERVNLESIAERAIELDTKMELKAKEKLADKNKEEKGDGLILREFLVGGGLIHII